MEIEFDGPIFEWRGPAPFYFIAIPPEQSSDIKAIAPHVTYGWGVIPVRVRIGDTQWSTSLFPKDGRYLVPLRDNVRRAESLGLGDHVNVHLTIG